MSDTPNIDYILEEVITLPSLPSTVVRITELLNDADVTLTDVGHAISSDPALSLKTLRLVNSAYYGLRETVGSVEHAVVLLGKKVVKNLVFTATVFETLDTSDQAFMSHSICTGISMRILAESGVAKNVSFSQPEEAFIFGLLHDVGKIILNQYLPEESARVRERVQQEGLAWHEAERAVLGFDHAEVGARLARNWKLMPDVVEAIAGHHNPDLCADPRHQHLAALVAVADYIAYETGYHVPRSMPPKLTADIWERTGIVSEDVPGMLERFFASIDSIDELIDLATD